MMTTAVDRPEFVFNINTIAFVVLTRQFLVSTAKLMYLTEISTQTIITCNIGES